MPGPDGSVVHILDALTGQSEVVKLPTSAGTGGKRKPIPVHAYDPVPATVVGINLAA
jgi:hypothetical protein